MDYLPQNPAILVSSINMLLRDEEFDSLKSLCYNFNTEPEKIKAILHEAGYVYSEEIIVPLWLRRYWCEPVSLRQKSFEKIN